MVKQELLKVADVRAELALVAAEYVRRYHAKVDTSKARLASNEANGRSHQ